MQFSFRCVLIHFERTLYLGTRCLNATGEHTRFIEGLLHAQCSPPVVGGFVSARSLSCVLLDLCA